MTAYFGTMQARWRWFALACLVAIALGGVRISQLTVELPAADVRFTGLAHMRWVPADGTLESTGEDPHGFLEVPAECVPLVGVVMEFTGSLPPGNSYIYPSPAHFPGLQISDATAVTGKVEPITAGFRLRFALPPSRLARFDLPDELHGAFVLRRVTFETQFAGSSNRIFSLFAGVVTALVVWLAWMVLGPSIAKHRLQEAAGAVVLVVLKLWLSSDLHLSIFPDAMHDDALFMSLGHSIANGDWLGKFGELTLSKGPSFPIFIAGVQLLRVPFIQAEAVFHALACILFVLALRPILHSAGYRLSLLALLLLDPTTLSAQVVAQVLRSGIQPALTLLTLAGFIGLVVRISGPRIRSLLWALLAGGALVIFWYSREESIWIVPSTVVLLALGNWLAWHRGAHGRIIRLGILFLPVLIWFGGRTTLRSINSHYYGDRITIDVSDGGYPEAYAALLRIVPAEAIPGVPVTKETRLRAYAVSPAFAELRPSLEGKSGDNWAQNGWEGIQHPAARKEIRGWFQWALRQAAREAGHYQNAATASAYWHRVADEINAACDQGRLTAGPRRSGFVPKWDRSLWPVFGHSFQTALDIVVCLADFNPVSPPSAGTPDRILFFSRMLHEPPARGLEPLTFRTHIRVILYHLYASIGPAACGLGLLMFTLLGVSAWKRRAHLVELTVLLALGGGALTLILIIALVDATSFSTTHAIYLAPAAPLVLTTWLLACAWSTESRRFYFPSFPVVFARWTSVRASPGYAKLTRPSTGLLVALLLTAIFGFIRWGQTTTVIPGPAVEFSSLNDLGWDPTTRQVTRAGGDPFGILALPRSSLPVRGVSIDFKGPFKEAEGNFYIFQSPANSPSLGIDGNTLTQSTLKRGANQNFTVDWILQDSKIVRVDLPDFLLQPLEIKEIRIKSAFAWAGSTYFKATLLSLALAGAFTARLLFTSKPKRRGWFFPVACLALILIKIGAASDLPLAVYGSAAHDDALYVGQADAIRHGQWLGPFNEVTLSKGPIYSLFLAVVGASGFRLEIAQTLFHAGACLLLVIALTPLLPRSGVQFLLLGALLFDPHTLSVEVVGRTLRSGIQPALTLLTLAGFIGLALRSRETPRRLLGWSCLAGFALSGFWFCREEGIWLLPSLVLVCTAAVASFLGSGSRRVWPKAACLMLPFGMWWASEWALRLVNWHFYEAPISMDVKDGNFPRAYGALVRITPRESIPLVPVSKETRLRAYAFSPAFKELEPLLEGPLGDGWSQPGWEGVSHPRAKKEMRGWFQWAIRQAAAQTGHYQSARTANEYWGRVADEINAACDRGDLDAGPRRDGFLPRWDSSHWPDIRDSWSRAVDVVIQFAGFGLQLNPSDATPAQYALFSRVTHEKPSDGHPPDSLAKQARAEIFHVYNAWGRWLTFAAIGATGLAVVQAARRKSGLPEVLVLLALLGGALALTVIVALVNATAFPAINGSYLSPTSPLVIATWVLAPYWAWRLTVLADRGDGELPLAD
jgi:hypothetical protein